MLLTLRVDGDVRACAWWGSASRLLATGSRGIYAFQLGSDGSRTAAPGRHDP